MHILIELTQVIDRRLSYTGTLCFTDLAAAEGKIVRLGDRLREGNAINRSISVFEEMVRIKANKESGKMFAA